MSRQADETVPAQRVGIVGARGIGPTSAAALMGARQAVTIWPPRGPVPHPLATAPLTAAPLTAESAVAGRFRPALAADAAALCTAADTTLIAVPANDHRTVLHAQVPHLRAWQVVIVSSMASLSALYLHEGARARGVDATFAAFGTTVLTARRPDPCPDLCMVRVMRRRTALGVAALPLARTDAVLARCAALFGTGFSAHSNMLETVLTNLNPIPQGPLALFNRTRIERAEAWPQYRYITPRVAAVIEALDDERQALGAALGVHVRSLPEHSAQSFGSRAATLAGIAEELHAGRGRPPGPTDTNTRLPAEDVLVGLALRAELGRLAGVPMPATRTVIEAAALITRRDFRKENDLPDQLRLDGTNLQALVAQVSAGAD